MIRLKKLLESTACPFPSDESKVREYLKMVLRDSDTTTEVFNALNYMRSNWTLEQEELAMDYGSCETWNVEIGVVLDNKGIVSQVYHGIPHDDSLPQHYYCSVGNTIIDFVVGQFWGYGLGSNISDPDQATFTPAEYSDILNAYSWNLI